MSGGGICCRVTCGASRDGTNPCARRRGAGDAAVRALTVLPWCPAGAAYERRLTVDGEETTLLVLDTWEPEQRVRWGWVLE